MEDYVTSEVIEENRSLFKLDIGTEDLCIAIIAKCIQVKMI